MAPRILSPTEFIDAHSECKYWNVFTRLPNPNSVTADELRLGRLCIASQGRIFELSTFHSFCFFLRFFFSPITVQSCGGHFVIPRNAIFSSYLRYLTSEQFFLYMVTLIFFFLVLSEFVHFVLFRAIASTST